MLFAARQIAVPEALNVQLSTRMPVVLVLVPRLSITSLVGGLPPAFVNVNPVSRSMQPDWLFSTKSADDVTVAAPCPLIVTHLETVTVPENAAEPDATRIVSPLDAEETHAAMSVEVSAAFHVGDEPVQAWAAGQARSAAKIRAFKTRLPIVQPCSPEVRYARSRTALLGEPA